jgi:hypothetical protein
MLKKVLLAAAVSGFVAGFVLPVPSVQAASMTSLTCKEAAKLKFPTDHKARHAYKHECKEAWKAQKKAAKA